MAISVRVGSIYFTKEVYLCADLQGLWGLEMFVVGLGISWSCRAGDRCLPELLLLCGQTAVWWVPASGGKVLFPGLTLSREKWVLALLEDPSLCFFCELASGSEKILVLFREKVLILNGSPLEILSVDPVWPYCLRSESQQQLWVLVLLLEEHHFASPASDSQIKFWPLREGLVKPNLSWLLSHGKTFDFKTRVLKLVMWEVEQRTQFMTASVYLCSPLAPIAFLPQGYWALFRGKLRQC